ncbi:MAG: membrane protein YdbS with pleckstrin-like domain [Candidatus Omnitrophota bacterium]|jgi:membrane protein YdbS with pleckstrin-like domain
MSEKKISINIDDKFIYFRVGTRIFWSLIFAMILSLIFAIGRVEIAHADGIPAEFSVAHFMGWTLVFMVVIGLFHVYDFFFQKSYVFLVTEEKIQMKGGVLTTIDRVTDINRVTDVTVYQEMWGKIFNYATVCFQTAGSSMVEFIFANISVSEAREVKEFVHSRLTKKDD